MTDTAKGIGYSVYFMLIMVFGFMGLIAWKVAQVIRKEGRNGPPPRDGGRKVPVDPDAGAKPEGKEVAEAKEEKEEVKR